MMRAPRLGLIAWLVIGLGSTTEAAAKDYQRLSEQLAQAVEAAQHGAPDPASYDAVFNRDPMRPLVDSQGQLVYAAGVRSGLAAQGIIWSEQHPLVVVEDELFSVGDTVGPYAIVEIHPDGLVAKRDQETVLIPLDRSTEPAASPPEPAASAPVELQPPVAAIVPEPPPATSDAPAAAPASAQSVLDPVTAALDSKRRGTDPAGHPPDPSPAPSESP